jgi:predicted nuclease of predicted toxin-antitoxin system
LGTVGAPDAIDLVIFDYARMTDSAIFTHDLDFTTILAFSSAHRPSVIQARVEDLSPKSLGPSLVAA